MDSFKYVVIGSGPAGMAAALKLEQRGLCIVDVGHSPETSFGYPSLASGLLSGDVPALLGQHWEMLGNLVDPQRIHPKLRAAATRYVTNGKPYRVQDADGKIILRGSSSHAAGGLSNVWGAQLFRYTESDLSQVGDWPFPVTVLDNYYAELEAHIGIAGHFDDMYDYLGPCSALLPPTPVVPAAQHLLSQYTSRKSKVRAPGLRMGRPRLGVMTVPYRGYDKFEYGGTEFFTTEQQGIYNARRTLDEIIKRGFAKYLGGHELAAFREFDDYVEIDLIDHTTNSRRTVRTQHLLVGCGSLQTARIVLLNKGDFGRPLPFIDHPPTLLPVFMPTMFGSKLPDRSFPVQMIATLGEGKSSDLISFYYPGELLWSDLLADIPLPMNLSLRALGNLLGGMLVAQIWETAYPSAGNNVHLDPNGEMSINYTNREKYTGLDQLLVALRRLGAYSIERLASMSPPGWGFHHAGCLPMRKNPDPYETHVDGRLWDSRRVRVIDGSVLPSLPAKNHSLTLMANAARIANEARKCGY